MSIYSHILVGLDLTPESSIVIDKAIQLSQQYNAKLTVSHIIEPLVFAYGGDVPVNLADAQNSMGEQASKGLAKMIPKNHSHIEQIITIGDTASELRKLAEEKGADLIIVGSHGRHGLAMLFGSTASGVLKGAPCDVLAVRI